MGTLNLSSYNVLFIIIAIKTGWEMAIANIKECFGPMSSVPSRE
jgi:hypothetical protein